MLSDKSSPSSHTPSNNAYSRAERSTLDSAAVGEEAAAAAAAATATDTDTGAGTDTDKAADTGAAGTEGAKAETDEPNVNAGAEDPKLLAGADADEAAPNVKRGVPGAKAELKPEPTIPPEVEAEPEPEPDDGGNTNGFGSDKPAPPPPKEKVGADTGEPNAGAEDPKLNAGAFATAEGADDDGDEEAGEKENGAGEDTAATAPAAVAAAAVTEAPDTDGAEDATDAAFSTTGKDDEALATTPGGAADSHATQRNASALLRTKQLPHFQPDADTPEPEAQEAASDAASRHNVLVLAESAEATAPAPATMPPADTDALPESPTDEDASPKSIRTYQSTNEERSKRPSDRAPSAGDAPPVRRRRRSATPCSSSQ